MEWILIIWTCIMVDDACVKLVKSEVPMESEQRCVETMRTFDERWGGTKAHPSFRYSMRCEQREEG